MRSRSGVHARVEHRRQDPRHEHRRADGPGGAVANGRVYAPETSGFTPEKLRWHEPSPRAPPRRRTRRIEGADWVRLTRCFVRTPELNLKSVGPRPARVREAGPIRDTVH